VTILGVVVFADGETEIKDERDDDENFRFSEIAVGDWLEIEGLVDGVARVRAKQIVRKEIGTDVVFKGPVTDLDRIVPAISILDQMIPLDAMTAYFDAADFSRTEEEFFRTPGDVNLGDKVVVKDEDAGDPAILAEADTVELD
jgi:hypothetical protein